MAYPAGSSGTQAQPLPPKNVDTAALLLKILAIFAIANGCLALIGQKDAEVADNSDVSEGTQDAFQLVGGILGLLIAVGIGIGAFFLAQGLLKGKSGARTGTWVLCGLWIFCGLCGGCTTAVGPEVDGIPAWYNVWQWIATLAILGAAITIVVLLSTPAANVFFKPAQLMPPGYPPAGQFGQQNASTGYGQPQAPQQSSPGHTGSPAAPPVGGTESSGGPGANQSPSGPTPSGDATPPSDPEQPGSTGSTPGNPTPPTS